MNKKHTGRWFAL